MRKSLANPDGLEVKDCKVGKGVFAKQDFAEGEIIGLLTGKIIDDPDYTSEYCVELDERHSLEPFQPFRFLNHCCEPNAELVSYEDEAFSEIYVVAIRDIEAGEEVLIDYAWPAESAAPCFCQSLHCRGWIVAAEELALVVCD